MKLIESKPFIIYGLIAAPLVLGALIGFDSGHRMAIDACTAPALALSNG